MRIKQLLTLAVSFVVLAGGCQQPPASQMNLSAQAVFSQEDTASFSGENPKINKTEFSLPEMIEVGLANNPAIKASRHHWQAIREKYPQVLSLPDPSLNYTYFLENIETRVGPQKHRVDFRQKIPFPSKFYWQGKIVKTEVQIAQLAYEKAVRDTLCDLRIEFYELAYLQRAQEITRQNQELLQELLGLAQAEYSKHQTSSSDVLKTQAQLAQLSYDLVRLKELAEVAKGKINALLNRPNQAPLELKDLHFPQAGQLGDLVTYTKYATKHRQELQAAQVKITKADHQTQLAFQEYFPDLAVGFTWIQVDENIGEVNFSDDGQDTYALTFGIDLPLWLGKRNAQVRQRQEEKRMAEASRKNLHNQLAATVKKTYYQVNNAQRLIELYQQNLLPQAKQAMQTAESWYRDGEGQLRGVLETQSVWLNFSLALTRAQTDYAQGFVELTRLCGGVLPQSAAIRRKQ